MAVTTWLVLVLWLTLTPVRGVKPQSSCLFRILCGPHDAELGVLNSMLFVPPGLILGLSSRPVATVLVGLVMTSLGIELAQAFIPGRFASLGDVAFNGLGAVIGIMIGRFAGRRASHGGH